MSYQPHAAKAYDRKCHRGHSYRTDNPAARFFSRGGQARYFCPTCQEMGYKPPKAWRKS